MLRNLRVWSAVCLVLVSSSVSKAANIYGVYITEFVSNTGGPLGEYVEITNTSNSPVNMAGWSEDDSTRTVNKSGHSLSGLGILAPGESAIFTETDAATFKTQWWGSVGRAPAGLKIIGPYTNDNLSSSGDEVNLYDSTGANVDRVTYNGSNIAPSGGGNASGVSRNGPLAILGTNSNIGWVNSTVGDSYHSFEAAGIPGLIGNPGTYTPVPEPATLGLGLVGLVGLVAIARRRRAA